MEFIDFSSLRRSPSLDLIFPGWVKGENVAFYSPHDDDVALGAGYLVQAVIENGGTPHIIIFCRGDAGYSTPEEKETIVATRKKEAVKAYAALGVKRGHIVFFDIPDFSLMPSVGRKENGKKAVFESLIKFLREKKISRVVFSSGHYEHWDHTAAFYQGIYTSPQSGDPILADLGKPYPVISYLAYSVWADFEPHPSRRRGIRADKAILAGAGHEALVMKALTSFVSQGKIMLNTVAIHRNRRRTAGGYLELYKNIELRVPIDFRPYFALLKKCR